jgi:hypothetical protein
MSGFTNCGRRGDECGCAQVSIRVVEGQLIKEWMWAASASPEWVGPASEMGAGPPAQSAVRDAVEPADSGIGTPNRTAGTDRFARASAGTESPAESKQC